MTQNKSGWPDNERKKIIGSEWNRKIEWKERGETENRIGNGEGNVTESQKSKGTNEQHRSKNENTADKEGRRGYREKGNRGGAVTKELTE